MSSENIKVKYKFDENYNPVYANGAYGGLSPLGEIIIHFYLERAALPNAQIHKIENGAVSGMPLSSEPADLKDSVIRFVETGIVLNYQTAKDLIVFLDHLTKELEKGITKK